MFKNALSLNDLLLESSYYFNPRLMVNRALKRVSTTYLDRFKSYIGISMDLSNYDRDKFISWIEKYDSKFSDHISNPQVINMSNKSLSIPMIIDKNYIVKLDHHTYVYISAGNIGRTDVLGDNIKDKSDIEMLPQNFKVFIFGEHYPKYFREFSQTIDKVSREYLSIFKISANTSSNSDDLVFDVNVSDLHSRSIDTLFFSDSNIKTDIINHIDGFLDNEDLYKQRSLLFKTGILLYGDPGTGKSSLVTAIATKYDMDVLAVDINTFSNLDVNKFVECINADNNKYIVLLEDIDSIIKNRNTNIDKEDDKNINKLLQLLDSNTSPNSVIFIATTNYKDRLDDALIRDGRFDLKVKVGELDRVSTREMCKHFNLSTDVIDKIVEEQTYPLNQSKLQNIILSNIKKYGFNKNNDLSLKKENTDVEENNAHI